MPLTLPPDAAGRYELLLELWQRLSRTFELPEILRHLLAVVRQVVPYDAAGVFVLNRSPNVPGPQADRVIAGMATVGFDPDPNREDPMLRSGKGIIGHVIRTGRPVVAPDVKLNPHYVPGREPTQSEIAVPICIDGTVVGALNLESDRLHAYGEADAHELGFFAAAAAISIEKAVLHHQVLEKQQLDYHMVLAREVQASLLPSSPPRVAGYEIHAINVPTMDVGGDYFDYLRRDDGRLGLVVADVSGKGVAAALIMATFRAALRVEASRPGPITDLVERVNRLLLDSIDRSRYVTAIYGILDPATGDFEYVNCGHNPPALLRADGSRALLTRGRAALGMPVPGGDEAGAVRLAPGDTLAIYTDGVVEPFAPAGDEFGEERLEALLRRDTARPASQVVETVYRETLAFAGRVSHEDDFTLMLVRRQS